MDNDAFGRLLHDMERPDDARFWHELSEAERLDYRTRGVELATAPLAHPQAIETADKPLMSEDGHG